MGQKINPQSFRLGIIKDWPVRWFLPDKGGRSTYPKYLAEDEIIRNLINDKLSQAGIASIEIERTINSLKVLIRAARPGFIIGRGGKGIEDFTKALEEAVRKQRGLKARVALSVNIEELKRSEISSAYIAQQIAWDLEKRMPFRRVMKKYIEQVAQNKEAKGVKILLAGRLNGAEIARDEAMKKGALPLQNLRADIDYGTATAYTTFGTIGIKVWIYKGEVFAKGRKTRE
ncbi:MAG TPA: 30S ribosomal protein S3 [Candidatus Paceibacterota bacterium]|nr:30S ribosomal protein S3 [Candidatus Paceibacterota bacterium]